MARVVTGWYYALRLVWCERCAGRGLGFYGTSYTSVCPDCDGKGCRIRPGRWWRPFAWVLKQLVRVCP